MINAEEAVRNREGEIRSETVRFLLIPFQNCSISLKQHWHRGVLCGLSEPAAWLAEAVIKIRICSSAATAHSPAEWKLGEMGELVKSCVGPGCIGRAECGLS